jgi:hypothetical protein
MHRVSAAFRDVKLEDVLGKINALSWQNAPKISRLALGADHSAIGGYE